MVSMKFNHHFKLAFDDEDQLIHQLNFNPYYQRIDSGVGLFVTINGNEYLNLSSNNYLSFAQHPEIITEMIHALDKYGASMCGTAIACGCADLYMHATDLISKFLGMEQTLLFSSCFQANVSVIRALVKADDVVFVDRNAHSSIIEGIRSTSCKIKPFKHNDVSYLADLIKRTDPNKKRFVATESVFSTEGSIAPFDEIYNLAIENDIIPIIDDSHGIGVIGKTGKGILEEKNIKQFDGIYTASTGKALGVTGGFVCSTHQIIEYLKYNTPGLMYSTAIAPALIAGIIKAVELIAKDGTKLTQKLSDHKNYLSNQLLKHNFVIAEGKAFICALIAGSNKKTLNICKALFEERILTTPFIYPSVAKNMGMIRMIPQLDMNFDLLDDVIKSLLKIRSQNPEWFN